jgi:GPN-loop GTPase
VSFLPLDLTSEDSLETVVSHIDYTMQYGEDEEPKEVCGIDDSTEHRSNTFYSL